ncbi:hypothetical protein BH20ACI1_BH20ACI1_00180 [soil metagenome]
MSIKLLEFTEKNQSVFEVIVQIENETKQFDVSIIDNGGIFGVQCPSEMEYLFQRSAQEIQKLIGDIEQKYLSLKQTSELQAA